MGTQREGAPVGVNLEERAQICGAGDSAEAFTDRPAYPLEGLDALDRLGDLAAPAEGTLGGSKGLHRRLGALAIPAEAQLVASPVQTPVLRVVVDISKLTRSCGDDGHFGTRRMLLKPILDQGEFERLELPLDLLVVQHLLFLHGSGNHPKNHLKTN